MGKNKTDDKELNDAAAKAEEELADQLAAESDGLPDTEFIEDEPAPQTPAPQPKQEEESLR